jgi:hypothetical protein
MKGFVLTRRHYSKTGGGVILFTIAAQNHGCSGIALRRDHREKRLAKALRAPIAGLTR